MQKLTGREVLTHNRQLLEREDGWYQDVSGKIFAVERDGLYEQKRPGAWYRLAPIIEPYQTSWTEDGGF